ncbi:hypothetical protein TNCV_2596181 [Trichonephila clavipes]|nr:hypothetical protein TNCV_2596181 [Trichonephila clavipes]
MKIKRLNLQAGLQKSEISRNNCHPWQLSRPHPVRHGIEQGLDDRTGQHIPCCFNSMPHFISRINRREVTGQVSQQPMARCFQ